MSHGCKAHLDRSRATLAALVALVALLASPAVAAAAPLRERVIVPDRSNLQLLAFWVAQGAGLFEREGVFVQPVAPQQPAAAQDAFARGVAPMAVLPAPMILRLASEGSPLVVVANLLANDPIDLVVARGVAEARGISRDQPLGDRLRAMRGLRIGVAGGPPPRLRALFASQGLDADRDAQIVIVPGPEQNRALADGQVDALYAHTPFLERALLDQGAVLVVDQAGGEVPALTGRMIHALVVQADYAKRSPQAVERMVRAIARAEELVHRDPKKAAAALVRAVPGTDAIHAARLVEAYGAAVPDSPRPTPEMLAKEIAFSPENAGTPDIAPAALVRFVDPRFAEAPPAGARTSPHRPAHLAVALAALLGLLAAAAVVLGDLRKSAASGAGDTSV